MRVGEKIKRRRQALGMTQQELGEMLGVGKAAVQKYESGQVQNLKSSHIKVMSKLFDVAPWEFIFDDDEIAPGESNSREELSYDIQLRYGDCVASVFDSVLKLNECGLRKVLDYAEDLAKISEYRS